MNYCIGNVFSAFLYLQADANSGVYFSITSIRLVLKLAITIPVFVKKSAQLEYLAFPFGLLLISVSVLRYSPAITAAINRAIHFFHYTSLPPAVSIYYSKFVLYSVILFIIYFARTTMQMQEYKEFNYFTQLYFMRSLVAVFCSLVCDLVFLVQFGIRISLVF